MYYVIFGLLGAALLCADQWVKAWTVAHLELWETAPLFPGFLELMRVHNYGAAWSSFSGQRWLLLGVTGVIVLAVAWLLVRNSSFFGFRGLLLSRAGTSTTGLSIFRIIWLVRGFSRLRCVFIVF